MADRRLVRAIPITAVLVVAVAGLIVIATSHWRRGAVLLAAAAWLAVALRLVIRDGSIGPLGVRGRTFDVVFLASLALLLTLATTVGY